MRGCQGREGGEYAERGISRGVKLTLCETCHYASVKTHRTHTTKMLGDDGTSTQDVDVKKIPSGRDADGWGGGGAPAVQV